MSAQSEKKKPDVLETTVDDDTDDRRDEATIETTNTVGSECLAVDVDEAVELAVTSALGGRLGVVSETGTGIIERVDEEERGGTGRASRGDVSAEPPPVAIVLLESEERLVVILESKVQGLGGEVTKDVGGVASPEGEDTFIASRASEAFADTLVGASESTLLNLQRCQLGLGS